jgi:hypothetical protein
MSVVKLDKSHAEMVKPLFQQEYYMGVSIKDGFAATTPDLEWNAVTYNIFCNNYLAGLNSFHAYGYIEDNEVKALISFYESFEEPAWYYTIYRSSGNNELLRPVLDEVIRHNEERHRYKFYTLVHSKHSKLLRRFHWSDFNNKRYDYVDEFLVPAKTRCVYANAWELLFKRILLPEDSIVRCNFLKQEYRKDLPIGGNL